MTESGPQREPVRKRLGEVAADATGFGGAEISMTRDLVVDPRKVVTEQATPGSPYPKPLRYYLTLNGLYLLVLGILGGFSGRLGAMPAETFAPFVPASGKSLDTFMADLDQWYSILVVPLVAVSFYPVLQRLFRRWSTGEPSAKGQAFTFMSGWSLWGAPFGLAATIWPAAGLATLAMSPIVVGLLFYRMGRGVWWQTTGQLIRRFAVLLLLTQAAMLLAGLLVFLLAIAGATFAP